MSEKEQRDFAKKGIKKTTEPQRSGNGNPSPQADLGLLRFIELIQSLYYTPELDHAKSAIKDGQPDGVISARNAISGVFQSLFIRPGASDAIKAFHELESTVKNVGDRVGQLLSAMSNSDLGAFLVPGTLKTRFEEDSPKSKQRVAEYVTDKFFPDERASCFIQASITSIHLACALSRKNIQPGSLFYTNSIVFPMILLQEHRGVSVYTHCGTEYDHLCGGWLPRHEDDDAKKHLKRLFGREKGQLRDAFVTPIAVSIDKTELFFTRSELVEMIDTIVDHSKRLVLMTYRSRIFDSRDNANRSFINSTLHPITQTEWLNHSSTPQLVIAYDKDDFRKEKEWELAVRQLRKKGFDVHWQDPELKWHESLRINETI
jgi:hypothetical protein